MRESLEEIDRDVPITHKVILRMSSLSLPGVPSRESAKDAMGMGSAKESIRVIGQVKGDKPGTAKVDMMGEEPEGMVGETEKYVNEHEPGVTASQMWSLLGWWGTPRSMSQMS